MHKILDNLDTQQNKVQEIYILEILFDNFAIIFLDFESKVHKTFNIYGLDQA